MLSPIELQILGYGILIFLTLNIIALLLHFLYKSLSDSKFREAIRSIIAKLDEFADTMENSEKKRNAIQEINNLLGWRKILVPTFLISYVIDVQVKAIRKMELITDTPNLHE